MFLFLSVVFRCYYVVRTCPLRCCWLLFSISRSIFVYCSSNSSLIHCTFCALLCVVFLRPRVERPRLLQPLSIYLINLPASSTGVLFRTSGSGPRCALLFSLPVHLLRSRLEELSQPPHTSEEACCVAASYAPRAVAQLSANPCLSASASAFSS